MNVSVCRSRRGMADSHKIAYTDCLYAKITLRGQVVAEITRDKFTTLSSLLATLRMMVPYASGLARLAVRNMTRGWCLERPLMLMQEGNEENQREVNVVINR